jgi:predicted acyltransferase
MYFVGVLHRIAVAYFFTALIFCFLGNCRKGLVAMIVVCTFLLIGYWALMTFVPVPGIGQPSLDTPGKNLAHYLDELYMPGQKFEGTILSTMAAVANCLLGVFAGLLLQNQKVSGQSKVYSLVGAGTASLVFGFLWAQIFPVIKLLWTSSYVLVACGHSAILLGTFHQIIEIWGFQKWARLFIWVGMNPITIYVAGTIVNWRRLSLRFVGGDIAALLGNYSDFVTALVGLSFALGLAYFLYRRQIFLRL